MNSAFESEFGETFEKILPKVPEASLQEKLTDTDKKRLKRKHQRECRDTINQTMAENDALNILAEGQSLSSYKRMRLSQSFETPTQKKERVALRGTKQRKHSTYK